MTTIVTNDEARIIKSALAAMQVLEGAFPERFNEDWQHVMGGLERMIWLREKAASHLFVTKRDGAFKISDPNEEFLFRAGKP